MLVTQSTLYSGTQRQVSVTTEGADTQRDNVRYLQLHSISGNSIRGYLQMSFELVVIPIEDIFKYDLTNQNTLEISLIDFFYKDIPIHF